MSLHLFPVTIGKVSPPIHGLLSRPTSKMRTLPTMVYFHGLNGSRNQPFQDRYKEIAEAFQATNINFLSVDLREHGDRRKNKESTGVDNFLRALSAKDKNPFEGALKDFERIVEFLIEKQIAHPDHIGVMGLSWGAMHAMYALKVERHFRCCIALLPVCEITSLLEFKTYRGNPQIQRFEPMQFIEKIAPAPLLLITGEKDKRAKPEYAANLYEKLKDEYRRADAVDRLAYAMLLETGHAFDPKMTEMSLDWVNRYLLPEEGALKF